MRLPSIVAYSGIACVLACTGLVQRAVAQAVALDVKASGSKTFYIDDRAGNNQVSVLSQSTLEDFTTVCNRVAGECSVDPKDIASLRGKFSLRVEDLRTGIELRDQHLRGPDWLDAAKFAQITIEITGVEEPKRTTAAEGTLVLVAAVTIKDKKATVRIPTTLTYLDESPVTQRRVKGDLLRLRSEFKLKLSDYGIVGPPGSDFIGLKVADVMDVKVTVFGSTDVPPAAIQADKPAPSAGDVKPPPPKKPPD